MSTRESSYAPKSPDLSSFYSGATSDIPANPNAAPPSYPFQTGLGIGVTGSPNGPLRYNNQPQPHYYNAYQQPVHTPPAQPTSAPAYGNDASNTAFNAYSSQGSAQQQTQQGQYFSSRQQTQFTQQTHSPYHQRSPSAHASVPAPISYHPSYPEAISSTAYHHQLQPQRAYHSASQQPTATANNQTQSSDYSSSPPSAMPPRKIAPAAQQEEIEPSPVRTKFPTARIKRIMQADEDVGKVAQQTPIAVGKALELFMVQLVRKSAEVAKEKNSKRITAPMLKQAVGSATQWDFLIEVVSKVGEEKEGGKSSRSKPESDSDEEAESGEVKKKGRGGRKKKAPA